MVGPISCAAVHHTSRGGFVAAVEFMACSMFFMAFFLLYLSFSRLYIVRDEVREASRAAAFAELRESQGDVASWTTYRVVQQLNQPHVVFHQAQQGQAAAGGGGGGGPGRSSLPSVELPPMGPVAPLLAGDVVGASLQLDWLLLQLPTISPGPGVSGQAQATVAPVKPGIVGYSSAVIAKTYWLESMPWDARTDSSDLYERIAPKLYLDKAVLPGTGIVP